MKKLTALLVSLAMVFTMLPMAAIAEGDENAAVPEDAEEISAGSFGFDGPEIFDESLTNPGVELGGDEEQDETEDEALEDETTPETDEDAPSEAETEEPAEEPTETTEPTEAETEPEVEPDNGVFDEEVEAFKEYVYSLGERELEEANVIELFLALGIISEDSEMTNAEYYQYVLDNGFDNMADLVDATIVWKVLYLRENEPDWPFEPVQSDPGVIEGPGTDDMPNTSKVSVAEIDAMFQLMARLSSLSISMSGVGSGVDLKLEYETQQDADTFWSSTPTTPGKSLTFKFERSKLDGDANPKDVKIKLAGAMADNYQIHGYSFNTGFQQILDPAVSDIIFNGTELGDALYENLTAITIIVEPKPLGGLTIKDEVTPPVGAATPLYTISGSGASGKWGTSGAAVDIEVNYDNNAKVGDTVTITVTNPNEAGVKSLSVAQADNEQLGATGEGTTSVTFTLSKSGAVTVTVKYKTHASVKSDGGITYKVKRGKGESKTEGSFETYFEKIIINDRETTNEPAFISAINNLYSGDTINLTFVLKSGYTVDTDGKSGTKVEGTSVLGGSVSGSGISGLTLGSEMIFTFAFTGDLPDPTITVAPLTLQSNGGFIVFTIENYVSYGGATAFSGATVSASCDATTNPTTKEAQPSIDKQGVTISSDGKFGIQFNPKKGSNINYDYTYDVTGDVIYEGNHFNKEAAITIKGAKAAS